MYFVDSSLPFALHLGNAFVVLLQLWGLINHFMIVGVAAQTVKFGSYGFGLRF